MSNSVVMTWGRLSRGWEEKEKEGWEISVIILTIKKYFKKSDCASLLDSIASHPFAYLILYY